MRQNLSEEDGAGWKVVRRGHMPHTWSLPSTWQICAVLSLFTTFQYTLCSTLVTGMRTRSPPIPRMGPHGVYHCGGSQLCREREKKIVLEGG